MSRTKKQCFTGKLIHYRNASREKLSLNLSPKVKLFRLLGTVTTTSIYCLTPSCMCFWNLTPAELILPAGRMISIKHGKNVAKKDLTQVSRDPGMDGLTLSLSLSCHSQSSKTILLTASYTSGTCIQRPEFQWLHCKTLAHARAAIYFL